MAQSRSLNSRNKENVLPAATTSAATISHPTPRDYKTEFANSQRKVRRLQDGNGKLRSSLSDLKSRAKEEERAHAVAIRALQIAAKHNETLAAQRQSQLIQVQQKLLGLQSISDDLRANNLARTKQIQRSADVFARKIARIRARPHISKLTRRGIYTVQARHMARIMADAGCARAKVGPLMTKIAAIFGVKIDGNRTMSRRTVGRAILEGGVASRMQVVHELSLNEGFTISADNTSHRGNNYEASKFQHRVPDYKVDPFHIDPNSTPKVREGGVGSTLDHSSEQSVAGWKHRVSEYTKLFNESPLAARLKKTYTPRQWVKALKGMNGDH
ncbi:hypothetical protein FB451DRAFT_1065022, partial [Mycena latifolia]